MLIDPAFEPVLATHGIDECEREPAAVIGTWSDGRIAYLNPAYIQFAVDNNAPEDFLESWGLGARLLDCVPEALRETYESGYRSVVDDNKPWEHQYRCPTPTRQQRFRLRVYPLGNGDGLLSVHTLFWAGPHERAAPFQSEDDYRDERGMIVQCASCRHVRRPQDGGWDFVASFIVETPARTSHGLCSMCSPMYS